MSVIRFLARLFWPFGRGSERQSTRKGTLSKRGTLAARTTDVERRRMFELYEQGLGTHAIAKKTGRSTHTVHSVLTIRGTRSLPERNTEPTGEVPAGRAGGGGRKRRRGKIEDVGTTDRMGDMSGTLMDKLEPKIIEACAQFIRSDPEQFSRRVDLTRNTILPNVVPSCLLERSIRRAGEPCAMLGKRIQGVVLRN